MKSLHGKTQRLFREAGRRGGLTRAVRLTAQRRRDIAKRAAITRWEKTLKAQGTASFASVRLREPDWTDPVYLEEVLSFGTLRDWLKLYQHLSDHPFGAEAQALEKVCRSAPVYGATPLWQGILYSLQGHRP